MGVHYFRVSEGIKQQKKKIRKIILKITGFPNSSKKIDISVPKIVKDSSSYHELESHCQKSK